MNFATDVSPIVFDLETCGLPDAAKYLEPVEADKRLTDPAKIKANIAEREAARAERYGLDWNVGSICCLGWWTERDGILVQACKTESIEREILTEFWQVAKYRTIVGYHCKAFDLKFAIQRSRYLNVTFPQLDLGRFAKHQAVVDLYDELTFNDTQDRDSWCMRRTLHAFAKRFGIPVDDPTSGSDIAALVAAEQWDAVVAHCASDVKLTVALAQRLGYVNGFVGAVDNCATF